ncbi:MULTISPECIES: histone-like nucleoid-structuring protein, MvaT/MvaU family [unclassified Hahella]|uniref:histone-like nucleoid-structuring protein, MvaT/MvaU family n=1 Tax=unclassified Hahella TaxID=2624107 RepID=UPI000FDE0037|nr:MULTISPECIES: histone-like nucleoid-structuring protein, MvaT/MvaU family [unclassified Hahella]AZZ93899.1 H-NS histone [Hahella sp. KA22]MBU6950656.1 DNA binding protein [Hahella sp. HN01]MDG9669790.1 DNA binding protein [Hahella sp. CR1]QAY57272.1 H-NS histone [Hahella sp. KA22]
MKKLNAYNSAKAELEALQKRIESLEKDEGLKKELEFKKKLEDLMAKYDVNLDDVLKMYGKEKTSPKQDKRRGSRPLKVYKNPKTGEVVETRGGNHKLLNEWKQKFGKEKVESWLVA